MQDLSLLQLARVKGLLSCHNASESLGVDEAELQLHLNRFADFGWATETPRGWRLTAEGRTATTELIEAERKSLSGEALTLVYEQFCEVNAELKATITAWQLRDDATPNDHTDTHYDQQVIARLEQLHHKAQPLLNRISELAPRLSHFGKRLERALAKVQGGDHSFVARPITDSYHTVWFELHEDLMAVTGLTRAEEAAAGRAQ